MVNGDLAIKKKIINEIRKIKIEGLISISLIGSFQYLKQLDDINDIDLIVLVKKLTPSIYKQILKEFQKIARKLTSLKVKFIVENRIGPWKPEPLKNKKIIQLHLLIYDLNFWKNKKRATTTLDWVNFSKPITGKPLKKITKIKNLKKEDLMIDFQISLSNISKKVAYTKIYRVVKHKIELNEILIKLSRKNDYESVAYNIIIPFLNYVRYFKPKTKKDKKILLKEAKKLPKRYFNILKKAFKVKEKGRKNKNISKKQLKNLEKEGIEFINYLTNQIK